MAPGEPLAGAGEGRQVGRRAAADEHAGGVGRVADPLGEPAEDGELELRHPGAAGPPAAVQVQGAGDEVAHGAGPGGEARDEGEVAGRVRPAAVRRRRRGRRAPARPRRPGPLGRRLLQEPPQLVHGRVAQHRAATRSASSRRRARRSSGVRSLACRSGSNVRRGGPPYPSCTPAGGPTVRPHPMPPPPVDERQPKEQTSRCQATHCASRLRWSQGCCVRPGASAGWPRRPLRNEVE